MLLVARSHWKMIDRRLAWICINKLKTEQLNNSGYPHIPLEKWKVFLCGSIWRFSVGALAKVYLKTN